MSLLGFDRRWVGIWMSCGAFISPRDRGVRLGSPDDLRSILVRFWVGDKSGGG